MSWIKAQAQDPERDRSLHRKVSSEADISLRRSDCSIPTSSVQHMSASLHNTVLPSSPQITSPLRRDASSGEDGWQSNHVSPRWRGVTLSSPRGKDVEARQPVSPPRQVPNDTGEDGFFPRMLQDSPSPELSPLGSTKSDPASLSSDSVHSPHSPDDNSTSPSGYWPNRSSDTRSPPISGGSDSAGPSPTVKKGFKKLIKKSTTNIETWGRTLSRKDSASRMPNRPAVSSKSFCDDSAMTPSTGDSLGSLSRAVASYSWLDSSAEINLNEAEPPEEIGNDIDLFDATVRTAKIIVSVDGLQAPQRQLMVLNPSLQRFQERIKSEFNLSYIPELRIFNVLTQRYEPLTEEMANDVPESAKIKGFRSMSTFPNESLTRLMQLSLDVRDRRYRLKKYHNCFVGSEAVDWLVKEHINNVNSRQQAVAVCQELVDAGMIVSLKVGEKKWPEFSDKHTFYRFTNSFEERESMCKIYSVYVWGAMTGSGRPMLMHFPTSICQVACGGRHFLALSAVEGNVYGWGDNLTHCLGLADAPQYVATPMVLPHFLDKHVTRVATQRCHSAALVETDEETALIYQWGYFNNRDIETPALVEPDHFDDRMITHISLGVYHMVVLARDAISSTTQVYAWGNNMSGQLGLGHTKAREFPTSVNMLASKNIVGIASGEIACAAWNDKGELFMWGSNIEQVLGLPMEVDVMSVPAQVKSEYFNGEKIASVCIGHSHALAVTADGSIFSWGQGRGGRLGHGSTLGCAVPKMLKIDGAKLCDAGSRHSVFSNETGDLFICGEAEGCFGAGSVTEMLSPVKISSIPAKLVVDIACGDGCSVGLIADNLLEVMTRAARKEFGKTVAEKSKILEILCAASDTVQEMVRKLVPKREASGGSNKRPDSSTSAVPEQSMTPLLVSKYHLDFEMAVQEKCPIYRFVSDLVILKNESKYPVYFNFGDPSTFFGTHKKYHLTINPSSGMIPPSELAEVSFQLILIKPKALKAFIPLNVDGHNLEYRHFLFMDLTSEPMADVKEIPYAEISGGEIIGRGASGFVSKVKWRGVDVAVKHYHCASLDRNDLKDFLNDVIIASNLSHSHIASARGVCTEFPNLCLVMEFLPLGDLRKLIYDSQHDLSEEMVLKIALDIAIGMCYLHERRIIHKDLKPDNVLLSSMDVTMAVVAKLIDFGTSKVAELCSSSEGLGTIRYMPPETMGTNKEISVKVDVWSFGMILYEMLEREEPYHEYKFSFDIMDALLRKELPVINPKWPRWATRLLRLYDKTWVSLEQEATAFPNISVGRPRTLSKGFLRHLPPPAHKSVGRLQNTDVLRRMESLESSIQAEYNQISLLEERQATLVSQLTRIQEELKSVEVALEAKRSRKEELKKKLEDQQAEVADGSRTASSSSARSHTSSSPLVSRLKAVDEEVLVDEEVAITSIHSEETASAIEQTQEQHCPSTPAPPPP